jgi:ankyrin repeat domain-containing protein 50
MILVRGHDRVPIVLNVSLACLKSLDFLEMQYRQDEVQDARADSCGWILTSQAYKSWIDDHHGLLWVKGKPGSGKSTLMKRIYKEDATRADVRLSFFFHRRGVQLQQTPIGMLRTMSHQLMTQCVPARAVFRARYNDKKVFGRHGEDWDWYDAELRNLLKSALVVANKSHTISVFIDALDEADENSVESIVNYIHEVHEELQSSVRQTWICFSCRHFPILTRNIGIEVCMEKQNEEDISAYVNRELSARIHERKRPSWAHDLRALQNQIASSARGVFLWAGLMAPLVAKKYNDGKSLKHVLEELRRAPPDLNFIYRHILTTQVDAEDREHSLHLMQWVYLAERPLSLTELRYSLALDDSAIHEFQNSVQDSEYFVEDDARMEQLITSLSGGLVEVTDHGDSNVVQFIHQSVNDSLLKGGFEWLGLESRQDAIGQGHDRLTKSCVNYLKLGEVRGVKLNRRYDRPKTQNPPFLEYAITSWFRHAQTAEEKGFAQSDLIRRFEWPDTYYFDHWIEMYRAIDEYHHNCPKLLTTLLHTSAASNLQSIVQELLATGPILEKSDVEGNRALHFAARYGCDKIVEMLLNSKADVQAQNASGHTALERAASGGHTTTIKKLLKCGAEVNRPAGNPNALYSAVSFGSYLAARMRLESGANINAQGAQYGNALQAAAAYGGNEPVVKLLLNHGAEINAQGGQYGNALQAAAAYGENEPVVKLLLNRGAEINVQGGYYGNALQAAAAVFGGNEPVVKLLLNHGAEINVQGGHYGNALQAAAAVPRGNEPVIKLLLNHGAEINAQGGQYGNALQAAAYKGSDSVVRLLLDKGANINRQDNQGRCAIQLAIRGNNNKIIDLILAKIGTPNWNYQDQQGCSALHFAASGNSDQAVELILKSDVNIDLPDSYGWTPLHWACRSRSRKIVQTLRRSGADPNREDNEGWKPLDVATFCGKESMIDLLQNETNQVELKRLITKSGKDQGYNCSSCYHVSYALNRFYTSANQYFSGYMVAVMIVRSAKFSVFVGGVS